jgi:serine/threonine-protein kinase
MDRAMQGKVLGGRYRLDKQLGQGGMGSVWLAEHLALRSSIAIKLMDPALARTPEGAERFRREAEALASLRSAHIVQVLDYGLDDLGPFLAMELLQGETLAAHLAKHGRLEPKHVASIMAGVARGIGRVHSAGIVHRDLKPENVFLVREDDHEVVKLLDFGIAKIESARLGDLKTRTGVTMGTPYYMSPEQAEGKRTVDHRSDLWSLGIIACECLTGARPFDGETWGELILNICARPVPTPSSLGPVPAGFDAWFAKAIHRDPDQRFQTAKELADALRVVVEGTGGASTSPTVLQRTALERLPAPTDSPHALPIGPAGLPKSRWGVIAGALVGLASIFALGVLLLRPRKVEPSAAPLLVAPAPPIRVPPSSAPADPEPMVAPSGVVSSKRRRIDAPSHAAAGLATEHPAGGDGRTEPPRERAAAEPPIVAPSPRTETRPAPVLTCVMDPFTGAVRPVAPGKAAAGNAFPCKQNVFTGAYQRL